MKLSETRKRILEKFQDIIKDVAFLTVKSDRQIKFKITFINNTNLRVSEVFYKDEIADYSYFYLDSENRLITGWDTAPHHKNLRNFPYHQHIGTEGRIKPSAKMNLEKSLSFIEKKMR